MKRGRQLAFLFASFAAGLAGCRPASPAPTQEQRYADWVAQLEVPTIQRISAYQRLLQQENVARVAPMHALLRSARPWKACGTAEFSVPPASSFKNMIPTLRAIGQMQALDLVDGRRIASGYRDESLNRCAGGSGRSRHLFNNALDLDLPDRTDNVARLCAFWRQQGRSLHLGLGFYTPTRIHLDTSGFRTWGADHTRRTSLCSGSER